MNGEVIDLVIHFESSQEWIDCFRMGGPSAVHRPFSGAAHFFPATPLCGSHFCPEFDSKNIASL